MLILDIVFHSFPGLARNPQIISHIKSAYIIVLLCVTITPPFSSQVHFDLALYHYMGRFEEDKTADNNSALFHLKTGADCGLSIAEFVLGEQNYSVQINSVQQIQMNRLMLENFESCQSIL